MKDEILNHRLKEVAHSIEKSVNKFGMYSTVTAKYVGMYIMLKNLLYDTKLNTKTLDVLKELDLYKPENEERRKKKKKKKKIVAVYGKCGEIHLRFDYKREWDLMIPVNVLDECDTPEKQYDYLLNGSFGKVRGILRGKRNEVIQELEALRKEPVD